MADENEQSDEIMALQSIYDDEIFSCNISDRPITGKITIFLDSDSEGHNFMCNGDPITIKHVPPLILDFSLPSNYPSESPPDVTLSCSWLTSEQLEILSEKLNAKWIENCNSVVLFTWFDFLKTEAIKALDLNFPIVVSVEQILKLTEESILRGEEIFSRGCHYCPVCLLVKPGNECICLSTCEHVLCKDCLSEYLTISIQEGNNHAIRCPCEECDEEIYPNIIKSLVCQKDFERYDRLLLKNVLEVMPDIMCCPRIPCQKPVLVDKKDQMGYCNFCTFAFCTKCKLTYHGVEVCKWERDFIKRKNEAKEKRPKVSLTSLTKPEKAKKLKKISRGYTKQMDYWGIPEDERMRLAAEYMDGDEEIKEGLEEYYGTDRMLDMVLDFRSKSWKWIKANTKKCPKCSVQIEKSMGCNHMRCSKCLTKFCWKCLMELYPKNPYNHYSNPSSPCYNKLVVVVENEEDEEEEVAVIDEEHLDVYN